MNIQNLTMVVNRLESGTLPVGVSSTLVFDMDHIRHHDRTTGVTRVDLAGLTVAMFSPGVFEQLSADGVIERARAHLEITKNQAADLFYLTAEPSHFGIKRGTITASEAAMCIRHFIDTGKVDWAIVVVSRSPA